MIRSLRSRALADFWETGEAAGLRPDLVKRIRIRLSRLDSARQPADMNAAGFNFHRLRGRPTRYTVHVNARYTVHVNGPWCITFEWDGEDAVRVDLEQYH